MNKILLSILILITFCAGLSAQYSISFRLVTSSGTPLTGQAANIVWTKSPHVYGTDDITGLTTTEIGTAGNYVTKGFTTFQYAQLWLSSVKQLWLDTVQTGSITTYLSSNYMDKTNTQTGFTGTKTLTGQWAWTASTQTFYNPYISGSANWISDYSLGSSSSLVWRGYADSIYGIKPWYYGGAGEIRLITGYKLYGRTNSTSPININTSHFSYSSDQLSLNAAVLNADSIKHDNMTVGKDTTWTVLGENFTKWRFISLKKGFYYNSFSIPDWKWVYTSFDETGALLAMDSMMAINEATSVDNETSVNLQFDGAYAKVDSLLLPPGKYTIDFAIMWERGNHNDPAQMNISDTIIVALKEQSSAPNVYIVNNIRNIETYADTTNFSGGVLQWSAVHTVYSTAKYVYVYGKYVANALSTALGLGPTAGVTRGKIIATLIR